MQALPRTAALPKLSVGEITLSGLPSLGPDLVGDDALVTEKAVESLWLESHASEFAELTGVTVCSGSLAESDWYRTNWIDVRLAATDAANAAFTESGFKRVAWQGSRLVGIALSGCTLQDISHDQCAMGLANFRFANLGRVVFTGCDLAGADFTNARLLDVSFVDCDLSGATFAQAQSQRVLVTGGTLAGIRGLDGLRGATMQVDTLQEIAQEMALELGLQLISS